MAVHASNPNAVEKGQDDTWGLLAGQSTQIGELQVWGKTLSQRINWRAAEEET